MVGAPPSDHSLEWSVVGGVTPQTIKPRRTKVLILTVESAGVREWEVGLRGARGKNTTGHT